MTKIEFSLDVSSDPLAGAENISDDGALFEINLEQGILIPKEAKNLSVRVDEATVWNNVFNISSLLNNTQLYVLENGVNRVVTIPDGSYSVNSLSQTIDREYVILGGSTNLIILQGDQPTQRVEITLDGTIAGSGAQLDFTQVDTFRDIIGFTSKLVPTAGPTTVLFQELGINEASFNVIEFFQIHADIGQGIRINNTYTQTIARVNITAPPGSQIVSEPFNAGKSDADSLIGTLRKNFVFWLTDQRNVLVNTNEI